MDKIPFEDGTLVKAGYVEIDGTKHETVQPEYTGKTPLSAYNLNKMQDNVENAINDADVIKRINIKGNSIQEGTPSIDSEAPIESVGDNVQLLQVKAPSTTINGVTFTNNGDGTITANGTATANTTYPFTNENGSSAKSSRLEKGTYTISSINSDYSKHFLQTAIKDDNGTENWYNSSPSITIDTVGLSYCVLIYVRSGTTLNNVVFKPKIEKGTKATPYSPYGQGSIGMYNCNKNLFNKKAITESYYLNQGNGVLGSSTSSNVSDYIPVRANETYIVTYDYETLVASGKRGYCYFDKNKTYLKGSEYTSSNKTFTLIPTEDGYIRFAYDKNCTNIQLEKGETPTDYVEHQSQTKALYTQQPFREVGEVRDRFVKQNGVWYEEHKIEEKIYTGNENFTLSVTSGYYRFQYAPQNIKVYTDDARHTDRIMCSHFEPSTANEYGVIFQYKTTVFFLANFATVDEFKAKLTELYNAGTPVYVDYVLATPTLIPCTPEQVEVLNDIYSAYGEGMTNITCTDEVVPVIEIVKETKETVQSENDKAISALMARVEELEKLVSEMQSVAAEEGA